MLWERAVASFAAPAMDADLMLLPAAAGGTREKREDDIEKGGWRKDGCTASETEGGAEGIYCG